MKVCIIFLMMALGTVSIADSQHPFDMVNPGNKGLSRTVLPSRTGKLPAAKYSRMALNAKFAGTAISEPDMYNWGASPLEYKGKVHLFHCRWYFVEAGRILFLRGPFLPQV